MQEYYPVMTTCSRTNLAWKTQARSILDNTPVYWVDPPLGESYDRIYLTAITNPSHRQFHNCNTCLSFLRHYSGLCYLKDGKQVPLFWQPLDDVGLDIKQSYAALYQVVSTGKISRTHVFSTYSPTIGIQFAGGYEHMYYEIPRQLCEGISPIQAPIREMLNQVLAENPRSAIETAYSLLTNNKLSRADSHKGAITWLYDLVDKLGSQSVDNRDLLLWDAIGHAKSGYINSLRSGVIAQLLQNIREGRSEAESRALWESLTAPGKYMEATTAPSEGNLIAAEKLCAELGITSDTLQRRFLKRAPDRAVLWSKVPRVAVKIKKPEDEFVYVGATMAADIPQPPAVAIFGHIKPKEVSMNHVVSKPGDDKPTSISFPGFLNKLKDAVHVECKTGSFIALYSFVEAAHSGIPLMNWHTSENTASWYTWPLSDSNTVQCNLRIGWNEVSEILTFPHMWDDAEKFAYRGKRYLFVLKGAKDYRSDKAGGVLFPEYLGSKLHEIRSVITAHNKTAKIVDDGQPYVCGVSLDIDHVGLIFRVTTKNGFSNTYSISSLE